MSLFVFPGVAEKHVVAKTVVIRMAMQPKWLAAISGVKLPRLFRVT
ncbi:MAG TPA: hypothetical protein VFE47_20075 [Tepidisphaeraceae bacterium]|jgi:hypothetical protein|nr:hypothetical protein [Tepidisphaeraceae bacterium]